MTRQGWTFADVWESVAERFPDAPAQACGDRLQTWQAFDQRADGLAAAMLATGLGHQAKVAQFLYNGPEYLETVFACSKAGLVPVNTNYRYLGEELAYLWDNADVELVVFHGDLAERCEKVRARLPRIRSWLWVEAGGEPCPEWATPYEEAVASGSGRRVTAPWGRSGQDLILLYTGGTTGQPKGVMWPQDAMYRMLEELNGRAPADADAAYADAANALQRPGPSVLVAAPLMHGTAFWVAVPVLSQGGCVVTLPDRRFDANRVLDTIVAQRVKGLCIVGDAFARPLVDALDAEPARWDLCTVRVVFSSGVMFHPTTKSRLLRHLPNAVIVDSLGSSEAGGLARSMTTRDEHAESARFEVGPRTRVIDDQGRDVVPGSGQRGRLAVRGHTPVGYYRDPVKTAETFVEIDGAVHVIVGDWAEVAADGTIRLLGRGSVTINTGGEKVHAEEVEEAVKEVEGVLDVVVVGVPDDRFGEAVTAVVEPAPGVTVDPEHEEPRSPTSRRVQGASPRGGLADRPRAQWQSGLPRPARAGDRAPRGG
jgi:acyl-CoA synthetase (AMP-forming)/AMP-acid ligase II